MTAIQITETYNLFRSFHGTTLPLEVCLKIVEEVVDIDPKNVRVLLCLSKGFQSLLKGYEHSITKRLAGDQNSRYPIRPSLASPEYVTFTPFSFPWLSESRLRIAITTFLAQHDISNLKRLGIADTTSQQPNNNLSETGQPTDRIKKDTLLIMFQLVDHASGLKKKHSIRTRQIEFLEMLSALELARLGYFVKTLGLGYAQHMDLLSDRMPVRSIRERICVFEDKVLQYGPYFAWAAIAGTERARRWSRIIMLEGLNDMKAFERGQCRAYASLQSVVWKLFCKRADCDQADSWAVMREVIDGETSSEPKQD